MNLKSNQTNELELYLYALGHYKGKRVLALNSNEWAKYKESGTHSTNATVCFGCLPNVLSGISASATLIGVELSLKKNEPKDMVIVRLDSKDWPEDANRDRYEVYESPLLSTAYPTIISKYGIQDSAELRSSLPGHVLLVGPYKNIPNHHTSRVAATLLRISNRNNK
jgi:hypothetical protein